MNENIYQINLTEIIHGKKLLKEKKRIDISNEKHYSLFGDRIGFFGSNRDLRLKLWRVMEIQRQAGRAVLKNKSSKVKSVYLLKYKS